MAPWRGFFILFFLEVAKSSALQSRLHSELKVRLVGMHEVLISQKVECPPQRSYVFGDIFGDIFGDKFGGISASILEFA